jgi:NAD(P)-dependent dehydrogenase (short-subunit alcohol dehydrogenase family)
VKAIEQSFLITGSTDGLGKQTALALSAQGATVLLHGRNPERLAAARQEIYAATGNGHIETYLADFSSLSEVRRLAQEVQGNHPRLGVLINNAGIGAGPPENTERATSQDGYELRFQVNYLAPYLLTHLLLPGLREAAPARIVNVASVAQQRIDFDDVMLARHYDPWRAYCQSKLALVMWTFDLAAALQGSQVDVNCIHPESLMDTKMAIETFGTPMNSVQDGVDALLHLATSPALDHVSGAYFERWKVARAHRQAYDSTARERLRCLSEDLVRSSLQE